MKTIVTENTQSFLYLRNGVNIRMNLQHNSIALEQLY